jgi:hypothetical protein
MQDRDLAEEERKHIETEKMLQGKREKIEAKLREHQASIQQEKDSQYRQSQYQQQMMQQMRMAPPAVFQPGQPLFAPNFQQPMQMPFYSPYPGGQHPGMPQGPQFQTQQSPQQPLSAHNHYPPTMVPNLPQYTNLDIPGHMD